MNSVTQVLKYVVTADTQQATGGFKNLSTEAESTGSRLEGLLQKSPMAQSALGKVGISAEDAAGGIGQLAQKLGPAAIGAVLTKGVTDFQRLAGEVLQFQRIAGTTAEDSSRWVEVLGDYNISADQGAASIGKFAKIIGTTPQVLDQYGVSVAKNRDGTVDLNKTLLNAADVFKSTNDETKRAALGAALFGKSWQDLVPVLEQGSGDIRKALDSVSQGKVMDQQDLKDAEDFRLAIDGLKDVVESLSVTVGKQLVPQMKDMVSTLGLVAGAVDNSFTRPLIEAAKYINPAAPITIGVRKFIDTLGELRDELGGTERGTGLVSGAMGALAAETKKADDAFRSELDTNRRAAILKGEHAEVTQVLAEKQAAETKATKDAEKAAASYSKELQELTRRNEEVLKATEDLVHAHDIDLPKALDGVTESLLGFYKTTEESQQAQKGLSESSAEYQLEAIRQRDAGRDLQQSMMDYGNEAVKAAEAQAALNGQTLTAEQKATIYAGAMTTLGTKFPPLATKAGELATAFSGVAGATEDAGNRMATAMEDAANRIAAAFSRIQLTIGGVNSGLTLITGNADRWEEAAAKAANVNGPDAVAGALTGGKRNP